MASRIIDRDHSIKEVDKHLRNPWKWSWLEKEVKGGLVGKCIRKVNVCGIAYCELCQKDINYSTRGWKALEQHILSKLHSKNVDAKRNNYSLSGVFGAGKSIDPTYGLHPMFKSAAKPKEVVPTPVTPMSDRITTAESMILAFAAENSLSFSVVPGVIDLAKTLAKDSKALNSLSMNRTTAGYKTRFGLGRTFTDQVIENMKANPFSLNLDESTSNNLQKVLSVLVSYYCSVKKEVVINHFASFSCIKVNSQYLYDKIVEIVEKKQIPWRNLMSVLMDSCNVMRGSKSGLETRIRTEKAPHLLDVDGDACHHVHNAAKSFCKPFNMFIEQLYNDIFNDFKWSPDIRELFQELCILLNVKYTMPQRYVSHRWLSVYDVTLDTLRLFDCLTIFYFALVKESERTKFLPVVMEIYHRLDVPKESRERIQELRKELKNKVLTKEGKERKERITQKIFSERTLSKLIMGLYSAVLPLLKNFVLLFEMKEPMIHKLHEEQVKLFKEFLVCYVKPEVLTNAKSSSKLKLLDVKSSVNLLKPDNMFIGIQAQKIIKSAAAKNYIVGSFLKNVEEAYKLCGTTLQIKLPLTNVFLKSVAAIHPEARGHSLTMKYLQNLLNLVPTILEDTEQDLYEIEIRKFQIDENLPECSGRVDKWWGDDSVNNKYPVLAKVVKSVLSCFHGPQVESSFNVMNDIIDTKSGRINIDTYGAIQTIKYGLKASGNTSVEFFHKKDFLHEKVDTALCKNMRSAWKSYKEFLDDRKSAQKHVKILQQKKTLTKRKAKELYDKAAKRARLAHAASVEK